MRICYAIARTWKIKVNRNKKFCLEPLLREQLTYSSFLQNIGLNNGSQTGDIKSILYLSMN
jgi:hypothetical protein